MMETQAARCAWTISLAPPSPWTSPVLRVGHFERAEVGHFCRAPRPDGWLYFGSNRPGGVGKTDIWRARVRQGGSWTVENLGAGVNTADDEFEAEPSPDGSRLVITTNSGFYESKRKGDRFLPRTALQPNGKANGSEVGPLFSPRGTALLFSWDD